MRRSDSAPISAIASARSSAANATGSAWKLPPDSTSPRLGEHQRIVGHARSPRSAASPRRCASGRGRRPSPAAGSAGCRDPARGRRRRCEARIALPASSARYARRDVDLARLAAHRLDARVERRVAALGGVDRQRAGDQRRGEHVLRARTGPSSASAVETCVPLSSARPSLAASVSGARPARRSAFAAGMHARRRRALRRRRSARGSGARAARDRPRRRPSPAHGMHGSTPALCSASSASITARRTPE